MTRPAVVVTHPLWRAACPWLPPFVLAGRIYQGPTGELFRARGDDGGLDPVVLGGVPHGGAAWDPYPGRRG